MAAQQVDTTIWSLLASTWAYCSLLGYAGSATSIASTSFYCLILYTTIPKSLRYVSVWTATEPREKEQKWVQTVSVRICWALPWSTLPSSHMLFMNDPNNEQWTAVPFKMLPHSNVKQGFVPKTEKKFNSLRSFRMFTIKYDHCLDKAGRQIIYRNTVTQTVNEY